MWGYADGKWHHLKPNSNFKMESLYMKLTHLTQKWVQIAVIIHSTNNQKNAVISKGPKIKSLLSIANGPTFSYLQAWEVKFRPKMSLSLWVKRFRIAVLYSIVYTGPFRFGTFKNKEQGKRETNRFKISLCSCVLYSTIKFYISIFRFIFRRFRKPKKQKTKNQNKITDSTNNRRKQRGRDRERN